MRENAQLLLNRKAFHRPGDVFGGSLLKGNPKCRRPIDSRLPIHIVLRANNSSMRLPLHFAKVHAAVHGTAAKYGFRIYSFANVGNHLHILCKISNIRLWAAFIRELTGKVALIAGRRGKSFWRHRPFTRIIRGWKRAFRAIKDYVHFNQLEADGHISRREITSYRRLKILLELS